MHLVLLDGLTIWGEGMPGTPYLKGNADHTRPRIKLAINPTLISSLAVPGRTDMKVVIGEVCYLTNQTVVMQCEQNPVKLKSA